MGKGRMTLSGSIAAHAERFTVEELAITAEELLRQHSNEALNGSIEPSRVQFYIERQWVDEPIRDEEGEHFRKRHLLQLCAVQVMRGIDLGLDDIGKLVRGVDNEYLKMLCDDPVEAEKKAAVMSNWLSMLDQGRRAPARKGSTVQINSPKLDRAFAPPPLKPPPPLPESVERSSTPDDLPDAIGQVREKLAPRDRNTLLASGPDDLLAALNARTPLRPEGFAAMAVQLDAPSPPKAPPTPVPVADAPSERTAPITPVSVDVAAKERVDESIATPQRAAAAAWLRHHVVDGVELHIRSGHRFQAKSELEEALKRLVTILEESD